MLRAKITGYDTISLQNPRDVVGYRAQAQRQPYHGLRALRDDRQISKSLRQQVQQTAQEMGYRPDAMLSALAHYRRGNMASPITAEIAWINHWPDPKKLRRVYEFDLYWQGAVAEADRCGYRLESSIWTRTCHRSGWRKSSSPQRTRYPDSAWWQESTRIGVIRWRDFAWSASATHPHATGAPGHRRSVL